MMRTARSAWPRSRSSPSTPKTRALIALKASRLLLRAVVQQLLMGLTTTQLDTLATVEQYRNAPTTRRIADRLETPAAHTAYYDWARTYRILRRLQSLGLIEHDDRRPMHWTVTKAGYDVLLEPVEAA